MSLVALCFVAVLAISLASYIAVCSRAMQLSNRSFQASVSQQLAEAGIEEALRAFNQNNWDDWTSSGISVDWDTTTYASSKRAVGTMTFPANALGQGATASTATVKLRVDNFDANVVGVSWSNSKSYRIGDLVDYNGVWYRSLQNSNANHTPGDLAWWAQMPIPWMWSSNLSYSQYDVVNYNGTWYRSNNNSNTSTPPTNWTSIPSISLNWNSSTTYAVDSFVYLSGVWYRCVTSNTNSAPPNSNWSTSAPFISWAWRYSPSKTYQFNDVVYYNGKWWRCINGYTSNNFWEYPGNAWASNWEDALSGSNSTSTPGAHGWSSNSINYSLGDTVYYGVTDQWYRCIRAHTSATSVTPASTSYWTNTPLYSPDWDAAKQYSQNDTVRYNGVWYLCKVANNGSNPSTSPTNWASASDSANSWSPSVSYTKDVSHVSYGGVWYRCAATHSNKSPNDTDYWTAAWSNSWGITTGAPVVYAEATVTLTGNPTQRTQLRATIAPAPLFPNAAAATTSISANSGGTVDSYDSSRGTRSSQIGTSTNYSAVLAADSTITLGSTAVKGYLAWPSPPSGIGTSASVKGLSSPASPNVDTSRVSRSPYIPQFTTLPGGPNGLTTNWSSTPKGTALPASSGSSINIGTPGAVTPSRYYSTSLTVDGSNIPVLNINGPVILYIQGDMTVQGTSSNLININSGGSAEIHIGDQLRINSGGAGISNKTLLAKNCILICDTTASTMQNYSDGDNDFYGVIYIPNTTYSSGFLVDNSSVVIYGAISAKKITYSGADMNLHYDTSLRYATIPGVDQPWTATEWRELPVTEQATMP